MKFCKNCNNMYYIKLEGENCDKILYYCRNCGDTNYELMTEGKCILKENITKNDSKNITINSYTKLDNTLPRLNYIKCPNEKCKSNNIDFNIEDREVIYIRHDHINMKYLYLCSHCDTTWNTEK